MDGERGEGRAVLDGDRRVDRQLLGAQLGNLAATAAAGGKGNHQDGAVPEIAETDGAAGGQQFG